MQRFSEDNLVQLSALSHALYCERRYGLIHLEHLWADNRFTAEGDTLHERVHSEHSEKRKLFKQEYGMAVCSLKWGLTGQCDLVELWYNIDGSVQKIIPVEFKRGKKKLDDSDRVQLCGQALCLEEMFAIPVENGQFYYLQEHRRTSENIDGSLREKTIILAEKIQAIRTNGKTPPAVYEKKKCANCSLLDICLPQYLGTGHKNVSRYITAQLKLARRDDEETS